MAWEPGAGPAAAASGSTTSGTPLLGGFRTDCSVDWLAPPLHHESSPRVPPHVAHAGWSGSMSKRTDRGPGGHFPASYPTRDVASSLALRGVPCASCPWTRRQEGPLEREGRGAMTGFQAREAQVGEASVGGCGRRRGWEQRWRGRLGPQRGGEWPGVRQTPGANSKAAPWGGHSFLSLSNPPLLSSGKCPKIRVHIPSPLLPLRLSLPLY
ncbi:uncharacterized protein ACOB8E_002831 isoform 3-T3 [Sarcophilus harrisii]